jgi:hypothetical protein
VKQRGARVQTDESKQQLGTEFVSLLEKATNGRVRPGLYTDLRALGWPDEAIAEVVKDPRGALVCGYDCGS